MPRVLVIDDHIAYSEMIALLLREKGHHEVKADILPYDLDEIIDFDPAVIVLSLVRKPEALGRPIQDFYTEVEGAKAYQKIVDSPSLTKYPLVITAIAVLEHEVPRQLPYVAYLEFPAKMDYLTQVVDRVSRGRKDDTAPLG